MVTLKRCRAVLKQNFDEYEHYLLNGEPVEVVYAVEFCDGLHCATCPIFNSSICLAYEYCVYINIYREMCDEIRKGNTLKALGLFYVFRDKILKKFRTIRRELQAMGREVT